MEEPPRWSAEELRVRLALVLVRLAGGELALRWFIPHHLGHVTVVLYPSLFLHASGSGAFWQYFWFCGTKI